MDKFELFEHYLSFGFNPIQKDDLKYDKEANSTTLLLEAVVSCTLPMDERQALDVVVQKAAITQKDDSQNQVLWLQNQTPFCVHLGSNDVHCNLPFTSKGHIIPKVARETLENSEIVVALESKALNESLELTSSILFDSQEDALIFSKQSKRINKHDDQTDEDTTC